MQDEEIQKPRKSGAIPWAVFAGNQLVLWGLIIAYCALSQSIFSAVCIIFLIVSVTLTIARPYYLDASPEVRVPARERKVTGYQVDLLVWSVFSVLSFAFLVVKTVLYFTGYAEGMSQQEQVFFEVNSLESVFVPVIIIPFGVFAAFSPAEELTLQAFKKKIKPFTPLPLYLVLCSFLLLIQIFSVSVMGLIYFAIMLYLFWMKGFNFKDNSFKFLLIVIQVMTTLTIFLSFLATCPLLDSPEAISNYEFFGINSLNQFTTDLPSRGHFICEVLLSLMCACLNRLCIYQKFNSIFNSIYNPNIQDLHKFQEEIKRDEKLSKIIQREFEGDLRQQFDQSIKRRRSLKEELIPKRISQKVEMKEMSQRASFRSDNHEHVDHATHNKQNEVKEEMFLQEVLNFEEEKIDETEEEKKSRLRKQIRQGINFKRIEKGILIWVTKIFKFLSSPEFSLRVIEIISIIVIQRYNNVYSFVNLIWLAFVSSVENLLYIRLFTAFVILPLEICNFVIAYFYNIPNSPAASITHGQNYGFQVLSSIWLDVLIFNIYLNYLILFVKSYRQIKESTENKVKQARRKPTLLEVVAAFIFRYTYLLTLAGLFFLGFSKPTIINIIYVTLFLIFFSRGDNIIFITKQKKKKKWYAITTFSKHFWFIIVYFTLLIIIAKYLYFLFFDGRVTDWLDPTGINGVYKWAFNFSLSSECISNTTPFFLIFVLAEIQIIIYRSYIYTNYSFSIMADFVEGTSRNAQSLKSRLKRAFIKIVVIGNELYYQSLYYISGFIIIGCSYRWSFIGLAIVILTCIGLLSTFSKKLLGAILFLNLTFLFLNYLILLINEYSIITEAIGKSFVDQINKISLFIGFSLANDSYYATLFLLNIVIFYFCVICYALSNVLEVKEFNEINGSISSRSHSIADEHRSFREPTVVDSQFEDDRFAQNYKRDVIESTKLFYSQNLVVKYKWVRSFGNFLRMFLTDLVAIFVIIECLYFRLSLSMFLFLLVYLVYYFALFDNIGTIYNSSQFSSKVEEQLDRFSEKEKLLENEVIYESFIDDQKEVESAQTFFAFKAQNILILKHDSRKRIWKYSAFLSVTCLILTYASQFLISDFYINNISFSGTKTIEIILFILGINSGSDFGDYVYFYYVMLIINIIEKLTIYFSEKLMSHEHQISEEGEAKDAKRLPTLENPDYLINCYISENFIRERTGMQLAVFPENIPEPIRESHETYYKQANLLIYFEYKMVLIRMNVLYGCIHFMIRFYLWLMLINLYSKNNVFGFAYLIAVVYFWFRNANFALIKDINKAAIIILLLQYIFLLLDLNTTTSPIAMPTDQNLSLLEHFIKNEAWVDFLAVSNAAANNNSYLASFLINSIIIFFTELCFSIYQYIAEGIIRSVLLIYRKYESILQKLDIDQDDQIEINLTSYKSWWHRMGVFLYENLIMNSYLIVSLLMFMLLSGVHNYLAIFLLLIAFLYIYLGVFTALSERDDIFKYTRIFFRLFNILQFLILFINIILNMPFVPTTGTIGSILNELKALTSIEQIILILFIQIWIDLNASHSFQSISEDYRLQNKKKRDISLRCLTFQRNNYLLSSLIREFKEILSFDNSIADAMNIIKSWHATTKRETKVIDYDFESIQEKESSKKIRQEIEEEQIGNDHKLFSTILKEIGQAQTDIPLSYNYYDTLRYIIDNVKGIITYENLQLSAWRFIKEDYDIIEKIMLEYDAQMKFIYNQIIENENDTITDVLMEVKKQLPKDENECRHIINQNFSKKLAMKPENFHQKEKGKFKIIPFLLSNIEVFIVLLIEIYYIVNPCILSLPLIAFVFCYYLIANKKMSYLLLIYIFLLIFAGQIIQIQTFSTQVEGLAYIKFFFYVDSTTNNVTYSLGYLYFIFIIIFFNQEVIRFRGNKFKDCEEVQNMEKAFIRILMNEEEKSKMYLWKYCTVEQEFLENINPYNIAAYEIENNLEKLFSEDSSFTSVFSDRKIGVDFYPPIAAVQIFLTIYLIFFYPLMTDIKGYSLQESTKYYQFSSDMVIGVLVHVVNIVIERYITIQVMSRRKKIIIKYAYTLFIFALFCWFIYYIAPYQTSMTLTSTFYEPSGALVAFSFFYFIYFYISALQIKYGYKEFKSFNSLMTRRGYTNYYMVSAYTAIPFLYEIKIIMDWTFSSTSLTLYDWFRQFSIYLRAFSSKINYYSATTTTVLGHTIPWYYKIMGWLGFIIILLIIFGPMILFSGLNPIAEPNLVTSGSMQLSLQVQNGNSFTLYSTSHFSNPPVNYYQKIFNDQGFNNVSVLQQMTTSDISQQFQSVTYESYSDSNWGISQPNYNQILSLISQSIIDLNASNPATNSFQLVVTYQLNRFVTQTIASDTTFSYPSSSTYLNLTQLEDLYKTMTTCDAPVSFPNFYISLIRLNTLNNIYKPRPIPYFNLSQTTGQAQQPYLFNVTLNLNCKAGAVDTKNTNDVYWGLYLNNPNDGLILYVYCDKYQNIIGGYGFTALYTSIILVVAGFIRTLFDGNLPYITYEMNPKPDNILQICEAINTLRVRKQFREEYLMYYELIDIIRSPEIMKYMSGSYPYLIEEAHEKQVKLQEEKEIQKQKTL